MSAAGVHTFGPDLSTTPPLPLPQTVAQIGATVGLAVPSCMVSYIGTYPNTLAPPRTGKVTAIRVRAGATTGPMRVNVVRFLYQHTMNPARPMSGGPFLQAYGPELTPSPDAVTEVRVDLPVRGDPTPAPGDLRTVQAIDALALEVLAPDAVVPLFAAPGVLTYPVLPAPSSAGLPAPSPTPLTSYTNVGFGVLMNADFTVA